MSARVQAPGFASPRYGRARVATSAATAPVAHARSVDGFDGQRKRRSAAARGGLRPRAPARKRARVLGLHSTLLPLAAHLGHASARAAALEPALPPQRTPPHVATLVSACAQQQLSTGASWIHAAKSPAALANSEGAIRSLARHLRAQAAAQRARTLRGAAALRADAAASHAALAGATAPRPPAPRLQPSPTRPPHAQARRDCAEYSAHAPAPRNAGGDAAPAASSAALRRKLMGKRDAL